MTYEIMPIHQPNGGLPLGLGLYVHSRAAKMTQTTARRLSYWVSTKLVDPHIYRRNGGPSVYSYNDLLAMRAVVRLREANLPLQQIRKAIDYLYNNLGSNAEWWNLKMVVYGKRDLITIIPKDQSPSGLDEMVVATRGGQKPFELVFADLVNDLLGGGKLQPHPDVKEHISIDSNVQGGAPVIKNSRIQTQTIYMWYKRGIAIEHIEEMYDGLGKDAIKAAIRYEEILSNHHRQ